MTEKAKLIRHFSNPATVRKKARSYLGKTAKIHLSSKPEKKYMVQVPGTKRWVHFGQMKYEDYTKHRDTKRRRSYRIRASNIKGDWKKTKYSPNNLAIHLLW